MNDDLKLLQGAIFLAKLGGEEFRCTYCAEESVTECENCGASLCSNHADFEKYDDVDVCADESKCAERL